MTGSFKTYGREDLLAYVNLREGETKLGQQVAILEPEQELSASSAGFVLIGIPEDTGIAANYGIRGAATTWEIVLKAFLNTQSNSFLPGAELLVLGHFDFDLPRNGSREDLMAQVSMIDQHVYPLIQRIVAAGKTPIIIGGGHNNAYPIIKGCSAALGKKINVVNIDAHADLRSTDGRHSGNGFSYALREGYLENYGIFGLQQNYVNTFMLDSIAKNSKIKLDYFEDILLADNIPATFKAFIAELPVPLGMEIDLDIITGMLSSAATPSGISLNDLRKILLSTSAKLSYLHICEGAYLMEDGRTNPLIGKAISFLITDFIKTQRVKV